MKSLRVLGRRAAPSDSVFNRAPQVCVREGLHGSGTEGKTQVRRLLRWSKSEMQVAQTQKWPLEAVSDLGVEPRGQAGGLDVGTEDKGKLRMSLPDLRLQAPE